MNPRLTAYNFTHSESEEEIRAVLESLIDREKVDVKILPEFPESAVESNGLSLIFVPDTGFDNSQSKLVDKIVDQSSDTIFTIIVTDSLLEVGKRKARGLKSLCAEINEQYGRQPVCIPIIDNMRTNVEPMKSFKLLLEWRIKTTCYAALLKERKSLLEAVIGSLHDDYERQMQSCDAIRDLYKRIKVLKDNREQLEKLKMLYRGLEVKKSMLTDEWNKALPRLRDNTVRDIVKQDAATYYSHLMLSPIVGKINELRDHLEQTWNYCPDRYKPWLDGFFSFALQPKLLMPIVGLFSSGKTTFINSLLNPTPEKSECLRTATTHNTPILLSLRGSEPNERDSVSFTWKSHIDIPILTEQTENEESKQSPVKGIVTYVDEIDPFAIVKITPFDNPDDFSPPIIVLKSELKAVIKPGYEIDEGEFLTKDKSHKAESIDGHFKADLPPYALYCSLEFIKQGLLDDVIIRVYRRRKIGGLSMESISNRSRQLQFLGELHKKINYSKGRGSKQLELDASVDPVKVNLSATLNAEKSPDTLKSHILLDSAGWDEFQGKNKDERGFAESDYTEWLLEKAELRVNNPLFKIVELVDTPGINSISQHHERITFDYINRGNAFIIIIGLMTQDKTQDLVLYETIIRVTASLMAQKIDKSEWGERTFIVFNWFHKRGVPEVDGDVVIRRIENLKSMLRTLFLYSTPKIYLIDASQSNYDDFKTLLGYPSITQLIEDIPKMVNRHFLCSELEERLNALKRVHYNAFNALDEEIARLAKDNNDEYIGKLQADLKSIDRERDERAKRVSEAFFELLDPANEVFQANFQSREDCETQKKLYYLDMKEFNTKRNEISDIVSGCRSRMKRKYGSYTTLPFNDYSGANLINNIPTFLPDDFRAEMDQIIAGWPSWFGRIVHRIRKGFREGWLDSMNKELRSKYYSDQMKSAIADNSSKLRDEIIGWVNRELRSVKKHLNNEIKDMTKSRIERLKQIEIKKAERRELEEFEENYTETTKILQRVIREMRGGK